MRAVDKSTVFISEVLRVCICMYNMSMLYLLSCFGDKMTHSEEYLDFREKSRRKLDDYLCFIASVCINSHMPDSSYTLFSAVIIINKLYNIKYHDARLCL